MAKVKKASINNNKHITNYFLLLILIATLFMSIGYASINNITMDINGTVSAKAQEGVFITDVELNELYTNYVEVDLNSHIEISTIFDSKIVLSPNNKDSQISYDITFYNNYSYPVYFYDVLRKFNIPEGANTNDDIIYEVNINKNDEILSKASKTITIIFKYKDTIKNELEQIENNVLNYYANFEFSSKNIWKFVGVSGDSQANVNISSVPNYKNLTKDNFYFDLVSVTLPGYIYGTVKFTDSYNSSTGIYSINRNSVYGDGTLSFSGNLYVSNETPKLLGTYKGGYVTEIDCTKIENYQYLTESNFLLDAVEVLIPEPAIGTTEYTKEYNQNTGTLIINRSQIGGSGIIETTFNVYYILY